MAEILVSITPAAIVSSLFVDSSRNLTIWLYLQMFHELFTYLIVHDCLPILLPLSVWGNYIKLTLLFQPHKYDYLKYHKRCIRMVLQAAEKRILVVDDDRLIVSLLEAGLKESEHDYAVTTALSAKEALVILHQERFALVMTDYQMPDMNGVELIQKIRALAPTTRIVLMSGHPPDLMEEMVGKIQADGYLEKPISIYRLWDLVEMVLNNP